MFEALLLVIAGFILLGGGGEALVSGAVALADKLNVPPLIIGLTIVAFGTSAPELMVSIQAALQGQPDIAVGNVVGSNISNIMLVLGVAAILQPIDEHGKSLQREGLVLLCITVGFCLLSLFQIIDRPVALCMVMLIIGYVVYLYRDETSHADSLSPETEPEGYLSESGILMASLFMLAGIAAVVWGADLLVDGAVKMATLFGVPEAVIGLTVVAIGTSLPELVICVFAAYRGQSDVAVGNILGSNISNILLILGVTGLIKPLPIDPHIAHVDVWIMLLVTGLAVYFLRNGNQISRLTGGAFVIGYISYIAILFAA